MSSEANAHEPEIAIVDSVCDVEKTSQPFGKRWGQQVLTLTNEQLAALQTGKLLALDIQGEYVAFLKLRQS
jgi:hypothetical protein